MQLDSGHQAKAVTLMCEMFEHICHIMAMVKKSPFQIALSMVPTTRPSSQAH
jgi:pentose-5-phosphate-3-epimerase